MYVRCNNARYFYSFGVDIIAKESKTFIGNKNITITIYAKQAYDAVMCEHFCIGFIDFMLNNKTFTGCTTLFSPNSFKKNDKTILNHYVYLKNGICLNRIE